jgi:uncharacterized RDD family membrane protein YckC
VSVSVPPPGWVEPARPATTYRASEPTAGESSIKRENRRSLDSRRVIARLIDWAVVAPVAYFAQWEWGEGLGSFALAQCALLIYHHLFEVTSGATLGKRAMRLRVARVDDGGLPAPRQAAARGVIGIFEIGIIAALSIVANKQRRRLGDYAAGTAVVDARKHPVASRPLFAGAVAYPVAWLIPALIAGSLAAKGKLGDTYRAQADAICVDAGRMVQTEVASYGIIALPQILDRRDAAIAALAVPHAWQDRHEQLMAMLREQTRSVQVAVAQAQQSDHPRTVLASMASDLRTTGATNGARVAALGYEGCAL